MNRIFIGMLFVFLNFNLDLGGGSRIGLIPTFLGYIYMLNGLAEIEELSPRFSKVMPWVKWMSIYMAFVYVMDVFGISTDLAMTFILSFASTILGLYISYNIIMGIKDIELEKIQDLGSGKLYSTWKLLAVFTILAHSMFFIADLSIIAIMGSFMVGVYYLYVFSQTKRAFYAQDPEE